jgi:hypothetical protein
MKPRAQDQAQITQPEPPAPAKAKDAKLEPAKTAAGGKKKPASSTSVAGRKIARKTAHSLIERRRRSKMNEEFAVLKGMIPACKDQEMHKLAILQVGLPYPCTWPFPSPYSYTNATSFL